MKGRMGEKKCGEKSSIGPDVEDTIKILYCCLLCFIIVPMCIWSL